jgi:uncharacterized protein involved in type VI secretion and phage assembly
MLSIRTKPKVLDDYSIANFDLNLSIGEYGTVTVTLRPRQPSDESDLKQMQKLQEALGGKIDCAYGDVPFTGHIHEMVSETASGTVRIVVRDSLWKAAQQYRSRVFSEVKLGDIVSYTVPQGPKVQYFSGFDRQDVKLAIQYQESDLAFLKRIVARYGGSIWCAGDAVAVGAADTSKATALKLDSDVVEFSITAALGPEEVQWKHVPYANEATASSKISLPGTKYGSLQDAIKESRKKHQLDSSFHVILEDTRFEDSKYLGQRFLKSLASGRLTVSGTLKKPVPLGSCVKISDADGNQETLVVRTVTGFGGVDAKTSYYFEAAAPDALLAQPAFPVMGLHVSTATVTDNKDPKKMNRVRVLFPWDENESETPWLRVASPYWGEEHVHYLPPRKGDAVLVVWGQDDLDPIVLGCLSIGHTVDQASETFVLKTQDGQIITVGQKDIKLVNEADGGTSTIEIKPDKIIVNADTLEFNSKSMKLDSDTLKMSASKAELDSDQMELKSKQGSIDSKMLEFKALKLDVK